MRIRAGSMMDRNEQESAWTRVSQRAHSMLEAFGSRTSYEDSYGSSQASASFPCGPTQQQPSPTPYWSQQHYPGTWGYLLTSYFDNNNKFSVHTGDGHPPYQPHRGTQFSIMAPAAGMSFQPTQAPPRHFGKHIVHILILINFGMKSNSFCIYI